MNDALIDLALWILASPIYVLKWLCKLRRRWRFVKLSYTARVRCTNCASDIWLVGIWRCGCGYTYRGHVLRTCPVCGSLPRMARCFRCGVTRKLPEP